MASTVKNPTLRMVLPVALGMAFGIGLGAVSLANGLFPNVVSPIQVAGDVAKNRPSGAWRRRGPPF